MPTEDAKLPFAELPNTSRAVHNADVLTDRVVLSERDTRLWLELLENPPRANSRLIAAAEALPTIS